MKKSQFFTIGIDEAGRAARKGEPRPVQYCIGIDEAGRGPLAGPVVVGGVKMKIGMGRLLRGIRDSKKLSARQREEWFAKLTAHPNIAWAVARVYPKTIDRINIARATNLGVKRVYQKLSGTKLIPALLDGSLYLPSHIPYKTSIRGDEKIPIISAASIIAKVTRDRIMLRLHKKYPEYHFDIHKGYGTKLHRAMIKKHGRSEVHRKSFRFSVEARPRRKGGLASRPLRILL